MNAAERAIKAVEYFVQNNTIWGTTPENNPDFAAKVAKKFRIGLRTLTRAHDDARIAEWERQDAVRGAVDMPAAAISRFEDANKYKITGSINLYWGIWAFPSEELRRQFINVTCPAQSICSKDARYYYIEVYRELGDGPDEFFI